VDATGAVALTKHGTTALVSGDLSVGDYAFVVYDSAGPRWRILGVLNTGFQPLDATLTALAAMAWSSGTQYVSLTAADTITLQTLGTAALKNTGTSGDAVPVLNTAVTYSDTLTVNKAAAAASQVTIGGSNAQDAYLVLNANAGQLRRTFLRTAATNRWSYGATLDVESGADAGTNFSLASLTDAGAALRTDLTVTRSTGVWAIGGPINTTNSISATTASLRGVNTTDNASVRALTIEGDRATITAGDAVYESFVLSNSVGTQFEYGRMECIADDVVSATEDSSFGWRVAVAGALTQKLILSGVALRPAANDGLALGTDTLSYSDLKLASGAVIGANNLNATITHVTGGWEVGGTLKAQVAISTETTGLLTAVSANKTVNATGDTTINDGVFAAGDRIEIYAGAAARSIIQDTGMTLRLDGTATTGTRTLAARGRASVYFVSNSEAIVSGVGVT
jgi:hypothetical protein